MLANLVLLNLLKGAKCVDNYYTSSSSNNPTAAVLQFQFARPKQSILNKGPHKNGAVGCYKTVKQHIRLRELQHLCKLHRSSRYLHFPF